MTWHSKISTLCTLLIGSWAATQGIVSPDELVFADDSVEEVSPAESTSTSPHIVGFSEEQERIIHEAYDLVRERVPRLAQLQTVIRHNARVAPIKGDEFAATFYNVNLSFEQITTASPDELNAATLCGNFPERLQEKLHRFKESHTEEDLRETAQYLLQSMIHFSHADENYDVIDIYDTALAPEEGSADNGFRTHVDRSLRGIIVHELAHLLLDSDLRRANRLFLTFDRLNQKYREKTGIRHLSSDDICADAWVSRYAANSYGVGMQNYRAAAGAVPGLSQLLKASGGEEDKALAQDLEGALPISRLQWLFTEEGAESIAEAMFCTRYQLGDIAQRKVAAANAFLDETANN